MIVRRIGRAAARAFSAVAARIAARLLRVPAFGGAVRQALEDDPTWTPGANLAVASEILRRIRSIDDPTGANRYLPHRWRMIFRDIFAVTSGHVDWRRGPVFLNFGAGDRNPMGLPLLSLLAGATRAYAVEPGDIREDVAGATLQETYWDVACNPVVYGLGSTGIARLAEVVDPHVFRRGGSLAEMLRGSRMELLRVAGQDLKLQPGSVDLIYSRSTLEHVLDLEAAMRRLVECLRPGGVMYHEIALDAHDTGDPVAFYYADRTPQQDRFADLNFLRLSDHMALFSRLGCAVDIVGCERLPEGSIDRERLVERFRRYDDDDLRTIGARILVRKPA